MPPAKKHVTKAHLAGGGGQQPPAAGRHHTDSRHAKEFDLDLNSKCPDPELQFLLQLLRPLLREVIEAAKRCEKEYPEHCLRNPIGYHNITHCDHS